MEAAQDAVRQERDPLADRWRRAIARTGYVPLSASEQRTEFLALAEHAIAALLSEVDAAKLAREIGLTLVGLGYTAGASLGATLESLAQMLDRLPAEYAEVLRPGLATLLGGVAAGFAVAARERLLDEQEASRTAVLIENRRAGEALRRQAALLDLAPDAILVRTLDGTIVFWNRGAEVLYGWSKDEALGEVIHHLLRTQFASSRDEGELDVLRNGQWEGELIHGRKDGSTITVSSRWAAQLADDGRAHAILEINTDITARKAIEAALREREAGLETAQSLAHLGSWDWDPLTNVSNWSPEAYRLLGYAEGEITPSFDAFLQAVHPGDRAMVKARTEEVLNGNSTVLEYRTGREGVERVLQARMELVRDAGLQSVRMFGTVLDVTERKRAEAERAQLLVEQSARAEAEAAQERFAFLAEVSTRLASSLDYEVTLRNVAELAVPTLADICTVDILLDDGGVQRVAAARTKDIADGDIERHWTVSLESHPLLTGLRTGGAALYRDVAEPWNPADVDVLSGLHNLGVRSLIVAPLLARGRVLGAITCFACNNRPAHTTVDQALAEELARRCGLAIDNARLHAEAQRATRLRDEFLSVAAHELKTPMTTLRGYAQLLGRSLYAGQEPPIALLRRSVESIDVQSEKLVLLTEQLLNVSRIEAGKLRLDEQAVDLVELVRTNVQAIQEATERHTLIFSAPDCCIARVDPVRFEQVVTNIVGNAVKYSPAGGPVEITLATPDPGKIELVVRDWGLGIPHDRRENLFDRFYQAHGEGHFGGLGLGLYVSRQIVELHGGSIQADFPSSGGSRFIVTLPAAPAVNIASSSGRDADSDGQAGQERAVS